MKILANVTVKKLKEYSRSYGKPQEVHYPFAKVLPKEIRLYTERGTHLRTLRIGTKLLIDFSGTPISERTFNMRIKKAADLWKKESESRQKNYSEICKAEYETAIAQAELWEKFLRDNPEKVLKYAGKIEHMNTRKGEDYLKLKVAKHINDGKFKGLTVSAGDLRSILTSLI